MNEAQQRTQTRNALLGDLAAAASIGLPARTIASNLRSIHAIPVTEAQLADHLHYLISKDFVAANANTVSAGDKRYTLTAAGREYLEAENLI